MKLKYNTLNSEEKEKLKKSFLETEMSQIYKKANRLLVISILGLIFSIISLIFDIFYKTGMLNYFIDGFLFIFCLIFILIMKNVKLKEINKYLINKKK